MYCPLAQWHGLGLYPTAAPQAGIKLVHVERYRTLLRGAQRASTLSDLFIAAARGVPLGTERTFGTG